MVKERNIDNTEKETTLLIEKKNDMANIFFGSISSIMLLFAVKLAITVFSIRQNELLETASPIDFSYYLAYAFIALGLIFFFTKKNRYIGFGIIMGSILFTLMPF